MTLSVGSKLPQATLKRLGANGIEDIDLGAYIKGRKVVIFAVPGAFTPTCAKEHLPGYITHSGDIKAKGIDEIICIAVNDPFVMAHWEDVSGAKGKVTLLSDGNCAFTKAAGMDFDGSGAGLGMRSRRYSMIVEDGTITHMAVEEAPGKHELSSATACMTKLAG